MQLVGCAALSFALLGALAVSTSVVAQPYPIGPAFQVNTVTTYIVRYPSVAMDEDGDFVVAWEEVSGDGWVMVGSTRKQSFEHGPVVPGQRYEYRVRAEAARGQVSGWSNKAAVYDLQTSEGQNA